MVKNTDNYFLDSEKMEDRKKWIEKITKEVRQEIPFHLIFFIYDARSV